MSRRVRNAAHTDQRGAAIMIMLLILILGAASFLLTKLGKGDARRGLYFPLLKGWREWSGKKDGGAAQLDLFA